MAARAPAGSPGQPHPGQQGVAPGTPARGVPCGQRRRNKTRRWLAGLAEQDPDSAAAAQQRAAARALPPRPAAVRPPPREGMHSGCMVWACLPRWGWWPGRIWRVRYTRKREEARAAAATEPSSSPLSLRPPSPVTLPLTPRGRAALGLCAPQIARERKPLTRLVSLLGDSTFAWCLDDHLEILDASAASRERLRAFHAYGARQKPESAAAAQVARALQELAVLEQAGGGPEAMVPWPVGSPSSGDEAAGGGGGGGGGAGGSERRLTRGAGGDALAPLAAELGDGFEGRDGLTPDCGCRALRPACAPPGLLRSMRIAMATTESRADMAMTGNGPAAGIVEAGCDVFGLVRPSAESPIVRGLLDPCTNSKRFPNIPAEVRKPPPARTLLLGSHPARRGSGAAAHHRGADPPTRQRTPPPAATQRVFDKFDDGLLLRNSWAGSFVVLNPPFESQLQWRFVNRAIDEVEGGRCPGVLLICRNSTDTSYFQRLKPYPRVFLRRDAVQCACRFSATGDQRKRRLHQGRALSGARRSTPERRFKDYYGSPIAFGICVVCLVKGPERQARAGGPDPLSPQYADHNRPPRTPYGC